MKLCFQLQLVPIQGGGRAGRHQGEAGEGRRGDRRGRQAVVAGLKRRHRGKAVQVEPMKPTLKAPGTKRLTLKYDKLLSSFGFNFNLRRYIAACKWHVKQERERERERERARLKSLAEDSEEDSDYD